MYKIINIFTVKSLCEIFMIKSNFVISVEKITLCINVIMCFIYIRPYRKMLR